MNVIFFIWVCSLSIWTSGIHDVKIFEESDLENVSASESILDFSILIITILFAVGVFYKKN